MFKRVVSVLMARGLELLALYAWQVRGVAEAGNVLSYWVGFLGAAAFVAFFLPYDAKEARPAIPALGKVNTVCFTVMVFGLVWFAHPVMASIYLFGVLVFSVRDTANRRAAAELEAWAKVEAWADAEEMR